MKGFDRNVEKQTSYEEYIYFVEIWLEEVYPQGLPPIHACMVTMMMLLDLSPMRDIIKHLYSTIGRPARIPENLLRSLIYMILCGHTSITEWVAKIRSYPFYAIISGFLPYDVPGVGTFYNQTMINLTRISFCVIVIIY